MTDRISSLSSRAGRIEGAGQWNFAALLTLFFPSLHTAFALGFVFSFFCSMMLLQLLWGKLMVPETTGRPLEKI